MTHFKTRIFYFSYFLFLFFVPSLFAQFKSTADGFLQQQFSSRSYGLHPRNFDICQNGKGFVFVGNAYGVIQFDGTTWNTIPLPAGNSGLSLAVLHDDSIAVGAHNDFGFLIPDAIGNYTFNSLLSKLPPEERTMGGIYHCIPWNQGVLFCAMSAAYYVKGANVQLIKPDSNNIFQYAARVGSSLLLNTTNLGVQEWYNGTLRPYHQNSFLRGKELVALGQAPGKLYVLEKNALSVLDQTGYSTLISTALQEFSGVRFSHLTVLSDGRIVLATLNQGMFIVSQDGRILHRIHRENGLQGNCIHKTFLDATGSLWLAMDNGLARLEINSPFRFAGLYSGIQGMGYAAATFQNKLYLATSQGLYWTDEQLNNFQPVKNIQGQIWSLKVIGNSLLCCHADGVYEIKNSTASPIEPLRPGIGNWMFLPLSNRPQLALKGTYEGLELYGFKNGRWVYVKKLSGFSESARIMVEDSDGVIWVCHGNKGIYKIILSDSKEEILEVENFSEKNGFRPDYFYDVSIVDTKVVFSGNGFYTPDEAKKSCLIFQPMESFQQRGIVANKLMQLDDGKVWLFSGKNLYALERRGGKFVVASTSFSKISGEFVGSYEFMYPYNGQYMVGSQEGFIIIDQSKGSVQEPYFPCSILHVVAGKDSVLMNSNSHRLEYALRSLKLQFVMPYFSDQDPVQYQHALIFPGEDTLWSAWNSLNQVEYADLKEGRFLFLVRAKSSSSMVPGEISSLSIQILPPWYRSPWAYLCYASIVGLSVFVGFRWFKNRIRLEQLRMEEEKKSALNKQQEMFYADQISKEIELMELRNKQLESEVLLKNAELASVATSLTQKNELLYSLKEKLELFSNQTSGQEDTLKELIKSIHQDLDFNDDWAQFQKHFDEVHGNFLHKLRNRYPKLKPTWLLLCAYVRLNKSNKEISTLLNISVSAVEKRKYRLREKLDLNPEGNLSDFLLGI